MGDCYLGHGEEDVRFVYSDIKSRLVMPGLSMYKTRPCVGPFVCLFVYHS